MISRKKDEFFDKLDEVERNLAISQDRIERGEKVQLDRGDTTISTLASTSQNKNNERNKNQTFSLATKENIQEEIKQTTACDSPGITENNNNSMMSSELESKYFALSVDDSFDVIKSPKRMPILFGKNKRYVKRIVKRPNAKKQEEVRLRKEEADKYKNALSEMSSNVMDVFKNSFF